MESEQQIKKQLAATKHELGRYMWACRGAWPPPPSVNADDMAKIETEINDMEMELEARAFRSAELEAIYRRTLPRGNAYRILHSVSGMVHGFPIKAPALSYKLADAPLLEAVQSITSADLQPLVYYLDGWIADSGGFLVEEAKEDRKIVNALVRLIDILKGAN